MFNKLLQLTSLFIKKVIKTLVCLGSLFVEFKFLVIAFPTHLHGW